MNADIFHSQHDVIPENKALVNPITHVALAFMRSGLFLDPSRDEWPSDRSVNSAREAFAPGTKILVAIGGWGDTDFSIAARNDTSRKLFAGNVARMVAATGADGVYK
jgi:GH18 family chitinase